jgi:nucleotidyltransferase/DNA polymerase involved in DNA repair
VIIHLDADAFFASVEQAADPRLRGRAIAVGGTRRGIIASASYEARKCGVYTPMPTTRARQVCPGLIVVPGNFDLYERFSRFMFSYAHDFTPLVETTSIDEGYIDLHGQRKHEPLAVAQAIRRAIRENLKITVSEGVASNKLVAQIAAKLKKPDSLIEVAPGSERAFLAPLANAWLPGIGPAAAGRLNAYGLNTIEQIAAAPLETLSYLVGGCARRLKAHAHGVDDRPVTPDHGDAKGYGSQDTFGEDSTDESFLLAKLRSIADRLAAKVRGDGKSYRTITLRLRYRDMQDVSRSISLPEPSDLEQDIYPLLPRLLRHAWERGTGIRMVGLRLTGIYDGIFHTDLPLDGPRRKRANEQRLAPVIDALRANHSIMHGHDLLLERRQSSSATARQRRPPS